MNCEFLIVQSITSTLKSECSYVFTYAMLCMYMFLVANKTDVKKKRRRRCRECEDCKASNYGQCKHCTNPQLKRSCLNRTCTNFH